MAQQLFGTPLRSTPPPSPLDPTPQNDFREQRVTPEAERATWHTELSPDVAPIKPDRNVELSADEWAPITIPVGSVSTIPTQLVGDDVLRRSVVIQNIGSEDLQLAPDRSKFPTDAADVGASVFVLPAGAAITLTSTRAVWVRASDGDAAGVSALLERAARER